MSIDAFETAFSIRLPDSHRAAIQDSSDLIHRACDFLLAESPHELLRLSHVNHMLHSVDHPEAWPRFLIAFASNGCGDYFAYDTRTSPYPITYMDPDNTIAENLSLDDGYAFSSFAEWHAAKCTQFEGTRGGDDPDVRDDDWRLQGQESYLQSVVLERTTYSPPRPGWDHDHCEFCFAKFMDSDAADVLRVGYKTVADAHWICDACFADFKTRFKWTVQS